MGPPRGTNSKAIAAWNHRAESAAPLSANNAAAPAQPVDALRLDWLSRQYVTVRTPLPHFSREVFQGHPEDSDGEHAPWDVRAKIDRAMRVEALEEEGKRIKAEEEKEARAAMHRAEHAKSLPPKARQV